MRIVKSCYLVVLFSLAMLPVCGEFPELSTLTDDVSNDFVQESFTPVSESAQIRHVTAISQRSVVFKEESNRTVTISASKQPVPFSSPNLLRLLTIQRK